MTGETEFSVARYLARITLLGVLLGVVLFLVYLGVATLTA